MTDTAKRLVVRRLEELGQSQQWLGKEAARVAERDQPFSQSWLSAVLQGRVTPQPWQVFAIEEALELRPGELSRHFGYLPLTARSAPATVEGAIRDAPELVDVAKKALLAAYRELRKL